MSADSLLDRAARAVHASRCDYPDCTSGPSAADWTAADAVLVLIADEAQRLPMPSDEIPGGEYQLGWQDALITLTNRLRATPKDTHG